MSNTLFWIPLLASISALAFAVIVSLRILKKPQGEAKIIEINEAMQESMSVYLQRFYIWISIVVVVFTLFFIIRSYIGGSNFFHVMAFFTGAGISLLTGVLGIYVATTANTRTVLAAKHSLNNALRIAFSAGAVIGMQLVGLGLFFVVSWIMGLTWAGDNWGTIRHMLLYFAMGASVVALFARIGGGIYTRAVNTGFEVLQQLESSLPKIDVRNPLSVAAGGAKNITGILSMGSDLLESYVGSIIATIALATIVFDEEKILSAILAPLVVAALGIITSILSTFVVRSLKREGKIRSLVWSYRLGVYLSAFLVLLGSWFFFTKFLLLELSVFFALFLGILGGLFLSMISDYYTSVRRSPTRRVLRSAEVDSPTFLLSGLSVGMKSTMAPVVVFSTILFFVIMLFPHMSSLYLGGMAAVGMVSTLGITLAGEAFGPIANNATNLARMSHQDSAIVERLEVIHAFSSSTANNAKGFAIGSAIFTALSFVAVLDAHYHFSHNMIAINSMQGLTALFVGIMLPVYFSSLSVEAVSRSALLMVIEVKRQFREISGIMDGSHRPDYKKSVESSSNETLKKMFLPAILALAAPILVGFFAGGGALFIMLISAIGSSSVFSILLSTAGGTWSAAKKFIEQGNYGGIDSPAHKSAVVGESFGNPLIDSVAPELTILIKVMVITALIFIDPVLKLHQQWFSF